MRFRDKVVLITGGSSGIGKATVEAFLKEGAKVAVFDYHLNNDDTYNNYLSYQVDVRHSEQILTSVEQLVSEWGKIDILVNNAGIEFVAPIEETTEEDWDRVLDTNLKGLFLVSKTVLPYLKETKGVIVNTASQLALVGSSYFIAYTSSKSAILNFTRSLALETAKYGVRVNAVCPGAIDTPLLQRQFEDGKRGPQGTMADLVAMHPLGRLGKPEEIAKPILFLSSNDASFMTGSALVVDGGYVIK
ncbi:SDR family NAD(P)-dependent oxidoreductase [Terrilactibacillus laevilacticus]|uniref:SDR family NAD(P)-dependent oxidoreductase n=1 Tax=Terrilactibacillus laevilacticus TaxID=1380157 RepID=A0ABW5PRR2_9BACI|nr:SDR family oxidoreductase [Terrilactibacillus laevilacticus]